MIKKYARVAFFLNEPKAEINRPDKKKYFILKCNKNFLCQKQHKNRFLATSNFVLEVGGSWP